MQIALASVTLVLLAVFVIGPILAAIHGEPDYRKAVYETIWFLATIGLCIIICFIAVWAIATLHKELA